MRVHRPLGLAGRARGVDEDREVFRPAGSDALVELARVALRADPAELAKRVEREDALILEVAQPLGIEDDDRLQLRQPLAHGECLVQLLVVLDEEDLGARVGAEILDLRRCVGRVDAVRDAAAGKDRQVHEDPVDDRVGEDRRAVAARESERQQAVADLAHGLGRPRPRPFPPETELLLAHQDAPRAPGGTVPEQVGHGLAGADDVGAGLQPMGVPEVHAIGSVVSATSSSSSSGARRVRRLPSGPDRTP